MNDESEYIEEHYTEAEETGYDASVFFGIVTILSFILAGLLFK